MVLWSQALKGKDDQARFKELNWGIRTWDLWNFIDCDKRLNPDQSILRGIGLVIVMSKSRIMRFLEISQSDLPESVSSLRK
jgi:hypothetical protein